MKPWFLIATPFLLISIAVIAAFGWDLSDSSESMERRLARMSVEKVSLPVKMVNLLALKKGPIHLKKKIFGTKKSGEKKYGKTGLEVSLIVISDKKSLAVINGHVLSTGDYIKGLRVKRIEKERVLLAGKKEIWKYMESR